MTKAEIVKEVASKTGVDQATVMSVVEGTMSAIVNSMSTGQNVYLRGFGTFLIKKRAEKKARNISKNTTIVVPAHNIPAVKPAKSFALKVKG